MAFYSRRNVFTARRLSLELEERNEGEELAVARTMLSDGTRVDRIGVLSTRTSFLLGKKQSYV